MSTLFVTSTGTDVGKTFVMRALIEQLRATGRRVGALKPVASGFDPAAAQNSDTGLLLHALDRPLDPAGFDAVSPWRFRAPLSPDMAAARENRRIDFAELVAFCRRARETDMTLIEGIGGVMVPLDDRHTVLDWIAALQCPVLLVAGSYLGTLSHTLSAALALRESGCIVAGIVVNESVEQPVPPGDTASVLRRFTAPVPVVVAKREGKAEVGKALLALVEPQLEQTSSEAALHHL